jgi:microcystin-dependent protein
MRGTWGTQASQIRISGAGCPTFGASQVFAPEVGYLQLQFFIVLYGFLPAANFWV